MKFSVEVTKTITTLIEVEAESTQDARTQVRRYGPIEAVSDYRVIDEDVQVIVGAVRLI